MAQRSACHSPTPQSKKYFQEIRAGCPDPDNDGDGILDPDDKCPLEKETFNEFEDEDGCPDKVLAEYKEEAREIKILEKVHFKFMSSEIMKESHPLLDQVGQLLKNHPEISMIQIEGIGGSVRRGQSSDGLQLPPGSRSQPQQPSGRVQGSPLRV